MNLDSSEKELSRYLKTTYNVTAPFDGIVTSVSVKGGAEIYKGSVAVSIADPTKFKAEIYVNELDIGKVEVGMPATVLLSASSTSTFNAEVTKIAPTGTNSSGVVSYKVTVELSEAQPATTSTATQTAQQPAAGSASSVQPPSSGQGTPPTGGQASTETTQSEQLTLEELKDGYSATITITIQQKENALMVLSKAISRQGGKTVVKIPKGTDKTEAVTVKTGVSNDEYTEITSGLTEGQEYVISTSSTTKTTSSSSAAGMMQMGGDGGSPPSGGGGPGGGF
jgi:HlyD family secretion protein